MKQRLMEAVTPEDLVLDILDYGPQHARPSGAPSPALSAACPAACLTREEFRRVVGSSMTLLSRALRGRLTIAPFDEFCARMRTIFERCAANCEGSVAAYIPQLAVMDAQSWGASVCSVDGQRFSLGDASEPFTLQSIRGVCPLTGERVLGEAPVRDALSLMHSCGMYDYSGQFAFKLNGI
ncbi:glutaminase liver isoform, mitochondrial-like [Frankliniella occidentalis]|uniref:glutaminase n=1 Tax=Frankliniella occidentalis TaxID=133901 RepID=A0A9C6X3G0_FRAOC|nr:glutaminase liver isoform, mitochondrial-like [Frankliniella occidentalis]